MINVQYTLQFLAMFTGAFRVKGGGRFKATTFCFLTVRFQCRCRSLWVTSAFNAILRSLFLTPPPDFQYLDELSSLLLSLSEVFSTFLVAFFFFY